MDAFGDLLGVAGAWLDGQEFDHEALNSLAQGSVGALGGILKAFIPFPASMLAQLVFPVVSGMVGDLNAAPERDGPASYIDLQRLFRQSLKSNLARYRALNGEWGWFQALRNQTIRDRGAPYEAAALTWLLNIQHDLAIDQESFFNPDCLQMLQRASFANVSGGRCEDLGLAPISDLAICEVAAHHLKGLPLDVRENVESISYETLPQGCYWSDMDGREQAYVNSHPGAAGNRAQQGRQLLCTSVPQEAQSHCAVWHQADTWQVSQWHAVLHLAILSDIYGSYPALRDATARRIADTSADYILLLTHSFKTSLGARKAFLKEPELIKSVGWKCFWAPAGMKVMLREGRDYYHQEGAVADDDNDDGKCRGRCDVLSSARCPFRQESDDGKWYSKYCVSEGRVAAARGCFRDYAEEVVSNFTARFNNSYMARLRSFHAKAQRRVQAA